MRGNPVHHQARHSFAQLRVLVFVVTPSFPEMKFGH